MKSTNQHITREACVENIAQAIRAQELGADRIELCENLAVGGTTPSIGTVVTCKKLLHIPVIVMIRPRGGNFIFNAMEKEVMMADIQACRLAGADGIATGVLTAEGEVDMDLLEQLIHQAGAMQVTFHKAIDETRDIERSLQQLLRTDIKRILTSGGAPTALEGSEMLKKMIQLAAGKISILAAGKVTAANLQSLAGLIPAREFHGRKIVGDLG